MRSQEPEAILKQAIEQYKITKVVDLFSGGKDSLVTGHVSKPIAEKLGLDYEALYCHTGVGVKENFEYVLKTCNELGWKLNVEYANPRFGYEEIVRRYGFPQQGIHTGVMRWLKWFSIRHYARAHMDEKIAFLSGRRKKESRRRMTLNTPIQLNAEGERKDCPILTVGPIFYWTNKQVWDYVRDNKLEICPVYETLHISGDCLCGCFAESGEAELLAIFHPETAQYLAGLEKKYGGKWGHNSSICGAMKQEQLDGFMSAANETIEEIACTDCLIDRKRKHN